MSDDVKGLRELIRTLKQIPKELDREVDAITAANAQEIELEAKRLAPVDTGKLRQSIDSEKIRDKEYRIRSNATGLAPYDIFVEFGTRFMRAQPFLFPAFFRQRPRYIKDLQDLLNRTFNKV